MLILLVFLHQVEQKAYFLLLSSSSVEHTKEEGFHEIALLILDKEKLVKKVLLQDFLFLAMVGAENFCKFASGDVGRGRVLANKFCQLHHRDFPNIHFML